MIFCGGAKIAQMEEPARVMVLCDTRGGNWTGCIGSHSWGWRYPYARHMEGSDCMFLDGHVKWYKAYWFPTRLSEWYYF
jgi:prepilin-type processing-associated H-X9-DG protein